MKFLYNYPTVSQVHPPKTDYLDLPVTLLFNDMEKQVFDMMDDLFIGSIQGTNQSAHIILQCYKALYDFAFDYAHKYMRIANFHDSALKLDRKKSGEFRLYYFNKHELVLGQITFQMV